MLAVSARPRFYHSATGARAYPAISIRSVIETVYSYRRGPIAMPIAMLLAMPVLDMPMLSDMPMVLDMPMLVPRVGTFVYEDAVTENPLMITARAQTDIAKHC